MNGESYTSCWWHVFITFGCDTRFVSAFYTAHIVALVHAVGGWWRSGGMAPLIFSLGQCVKMSG
jgi:hypothetical protein